MNLVSKKTPLISEEILKLIKNRFTFVKELGSGSFGYVDIFHDNISNKNLVIKNLTVNSDNIDYISNEIFILKKLKQLSCKYISCYIDHYNLDKDVFILQTLDYTDTLYDILTSKKKLSNQIKYKIIKNLIRGINFLHKNKVAHNDIKLTNIVGSSKTGKIKFIDFGVSTYNVNKIFSYCGTPSFVSPEMRARFISKPSGPFSLEFGMRSDIWSLGVNIFYVLFRRPPPVENGKFPVNTIKFVLNSGIPEIYKEILYGTYTFDPELRITASELNEKIKKLKLN